MFDNGHSVDKTNHTTGRQDEIVPATERTDTVKDNPSNESDDLAIENTLIEEQMSEEYDVQPAASRSNRENLGATFTTMR